VPGWFFEFRPCDYTLQVVHLTRLLIHQRGSKTSLTKNVHRLQHRLQGSLIPFAPYAFAVQRQFHWVEFPRLFILHSFWNKPNHDPVYRLHLWSSDFDHPISLVPKSFRIPLSHSSDCVTLKFFTPYRIAFPQVIPITAYLPFTPSPYEQHLPPLYDRVCWHNH